MNVVNHNKQYVYVWKEWKKDTWCVLFWATWFYSQFTGNYIKMQQNNDRVFTVGYSSNSMGSIRFHMPNTSMRSLARKWTDFTATLVSFGDHILSKSLAWWSKNSLKCLANENSMKTQWKFNRNATNLNKKTWYFCNWRWPINHGKRIKNFKHPDAPHLVTKRCT